jgi:hypothetical protein
MCYDYTLLQQYFFENKSTTLLNLDRNLVNFTLEIENCLQLKKDVLPYKIKRWIKNC